MVVGNVMAGLGTLEMIVDRINNYLLPRKSSEIPDVRGIPLTMTEEVRQIAEQFLRNRGIDTTRQDEATGWDIFWAREMAAAMIAIPNRGGMYETYLPGRFLHYDLLAYTIASLFNGRVNSIDGKKVAEIGSGSGLGLMKLAQKGALVTGMDYSIMAIEFARYLSRHYEVEDRVTLVQGDYFNMPPQMLENAPFDVVYNSGVLEHEERAEELVGQMAGITRPGGHVVITVPNESGVFYRRFKNRETTIKDRFTRLVGIPVEHRRYSHNIPRLMGGNGLLAVRVDGLQVAPSAPIRKEDIERDARTFDGYLPRRDVPPNIEDRVNAWTVLELYATRDFRLRYGWSRYYVGQK